MKIDGQVIGPSIHTIPIIREGRTIIIQAKAVLSYADFHKLCPPPVPPMKMIRGGKKVPDVEDKEYLNQVHNYSRNKTNYMFVTSLLATPKLEFEKVKLIDCSTWHLLDEELQDAGFSEMEITAIINGVLDANGLNEQKIEAARESFLAQTQLDKLEQSDCLVPGQTNTQCLSVANGLVSSHQE